MRIGLQCLVLVGVWVGGGGDVGGRGRYKTACVIKANVQRAAYLLRGNNITYIPLSRLYPCNKSHTVPSGLYYYYYTVGKGSSWYKTHIA